MLHIPFLLRFVLNVVMRSRRENRLKSYRRIQLRGTAMPFPCSSCARSPSKECKVEVSGNTCGEYTRAQKTCDLLISDATCKVFSLYSLPVPVPVYNLFFSGNRLESEKNKIRSDIQNVVNNYSYARSRIESLLDSERGVRDRRLA